MKRLVTLVAALSLAVPVIQFEAGLLDRLNVALGNAGAPTTSTSSAPDLHVEVPSALQPLVRALSR